METEQNASSTDMPEPPAPPAALEAAALAVAEAGEETLRAAVDASHAAPAPASADAQQLAHHEGLLNTLLDRAHEFATFMAEVRPLLVGLESVLSQHAPQVTGAVAARVEALEGFATDLVASLGNHFSGKLVLPTPPAA